MSKSTGETVSRTLRQEFESGTKYPKESDFDRQAAMIAHNVSSGAKEDRSFNTSPTVLDQSIVKVSSNKPLDGSYASKQ